MNNDFCKAIIKYEDNKYFCEGHWDITGINELNLENIENNLSNYLNIDLDLSRICSLDTYGILSLLRIKKRLEQNNHKVFFIGLKNKYQILLRLVLKYYSDDLEINNKLPNIQVRYLIKIGYTIVLLKLSIVDFINFIGEITISFHKIISHPYNIRWHLILHNIETAGVNAVPTIAMLAMMIGIVIAYQGSQQLQIYGANIFIVEIVSITNIREIAPLITAIGIAGRTGSAYTAEIGSMHINEEVDALRTIGVNPIDFIVIPKLIALLISLPLLTVLADIVSVFGGMIMADLVLDINFNDFLERIPTVIGVNSFVLGLEKSIVFAIIIAQVSCYQGFKVNGSTESIGKHATKSVVQSIFLVVASDATFSVLLSGISL